MGESQLEDVPTVLVKWNTSNLKSFVNRAYSFPSSSVCPWKLMDQPFGGASKSTASVMVYVNDAGTMIDVDWGATITKGDSVLHDATVELSAS